MSRTCVALSLILAAGVAGSPAAGQASAPTRPASMPADLPAAIRETVRSLVRCARSRSDMQRAATDLRRMRTAYLRALARFADDPDPEVQVRLSDTIDRFVIAARLKRVLAKLPPDQRRKLVRLHTERPELVAEVFSPDLGKCVAAMKRIAEMDDPAALAEPLVVISLRHPAPELQAAAAGAASTGKYRGDTVADALTSVLERTSSREWSTGWWDQANPPKHMTALTALQAIKAARAVPALVELMRRERIGMNVRTLLAEAIGQIGDKRTIPLLLPDLAKTSSRYSWSRGRVSGTTAQADLALLALLRVTEQDPGDYNVISNGQFNFLQIGFASAQARQKAIAKFRKWWATHRSARPYRDLKPLRPAPASRPSAPPGPTTGPTTASRPTTMPAWPDTGTICARLERRTGQWVRGFRARRFRQRQAAQTQLLRLAEAMLDPLVALADGANEPVRRLALDTLGETVAAVRIERTQAALAPDQRDRFRRFRRKYPDIVTEFFSLSWTRQKQGVEKIGRIDDPGQLAEPLLLAALKRQSKHTVGAAAKVLAGGKYRDDRVVDALIARLQKAGPKDWQQSWYDRRGAPGPHLTILAALKAIRSPRGGPALLKLLLNDRSHSYVATPVAEVLIAIGDKSLLPALVESLGPTAIYSSWSSGKTKLTMARSDPLLLVAIKLTGQKPGDYRIGSRTGGYGYRGKYTLYGFKDDADRKWAVGRFRKWWAKHKNDPPYRSKSLSE